MGYSIVPAEINKQVGPFNLLLDAEPTELPNTTGHHDLCQGENSKAEGHPQNLSPSHSDSSAEETLQPAEFSKAMDDHVLQLVLQAGEGTVGMLPQR